MRNFSIVFIKKGKEDNEPEQILGTMTIDDNGTSDDFPLASKAFRQCSPVLLNADILRITRI